MDGAPREMPEPQPLPPYRDPRAALLEALPALNPPARMSVTDAAERYMRVKVGGQWQDFDRNLTPYMIEPSDMMASRKYMGLAFCGPSQSGKTQMLQSTAAYIAVCHPGRTAIFQMTRDAASEYSQEKIGPMIRNSPELRSRLANVKGADNIFEKKFKGGMRLTINWPTITQFSSATIRTVLQTDYDHFEDSIGGEGDGYTLGKQRTKTEGSLGMCAVESTPGRPIIVENWKPTTIHEAPPVSGGVLALYNEGTRARFYWTCPTCEEMFEPRFDLLKYDAALQPAEAAENVYMGCPKNGCVINHTQKYALNLGGQWLHESRCGQKAVPIGHPDIRPTDMVSYWMNGVVAYFENWATLVANIETAKRHFAKTDSEDKLISATNTGLGEPYLPRAMAEDGEITMEALKGNLKDWPRGVAPEWTRCITIGIDVQDNRFPVGVMAWGEDGECALIDRFDLHTPPTGAPGADNRMLMPPKYIEDWEVLPELMDRVWPVQGTEYGLKAISIGYDFHGSPGVSDRAESFWRARRKIDGEGRWFAIRGHGGFKTGGRVWYAPPQGGHGGKKARHMMLLNVATDKMKDVLCAALLREEGGAGAMHLSRWMLEDGDDQLKEFTAERRGPKGWEKRAGMPRNENIDLAGYARAVLIHQGYEGIDYAAPPVWAVLGPDNALAVLMGDEPENSLSPKPAAKPKPKKMKWLDR